MVFPVVQCFVLLKNPPLGRDGLVLGEWVTLIGSILGLISLVAGGVMWFTSAIRKQYAAEREFNHLKRNLEQLGQNLAVIEREFSSQFDQLDDGHRDLKVAIDAIKTLQLEIKAMNYAALRNGGMIDTQ
jgi:hypothetical protein